VDGHRPEKLAVVAGRVVGLDRHDAVHVDLEADLDLQLCRYRERLPRSSLVLATMLRVDE
jgi:hypothetical protein